MIDHNMSNGVQYMYQLFKNDYGDSCEGTLKRFNGLFMNYPTLVQNHPFCLKCKVIRKLAALLEFLLGPTFCQCFQCRMRN